MITAVHTIVYADDAEAARAFFRDEISLMCDDLERTVAELRGKGAELTRDIRDDGFGLTTMVRIPGPAR